MARKKPAAKETIFLVNVDVYGDDVATVARVCLTTDDRALLARYRARFEMDIDDGLNPSHHAYYWAVDLASGEAGEDYVRQALGLPDEECGTIDDDFVRIEGTCGGIRSPLDTELNYVEVTASGVRWTAVHEHAEYLYRTREISWASVLAEP